jgi:hypothetical protein
MPTVPLLTSLAHNKKNTINGYFLIIEVAVLIGRRSMGLLSRLRNPEAIQLPVMPRHDQVVDAKFYEIFGQGRFNKKSKFGFGIVLIDTDGQQSASFLVGHKPATIDAATDSVLGPFGPLPRRYRGPQPFSQSYVHKDGVFKEDLLIAKLADQPTMHEMEVADAKRELMAKLINERRLRPSEEFTPITYNPPVTQHAPFGPYDLIG